MCKYSLALCFLMISLTKSDISNLSSLRSLHDDILNPYFDLAPKKHSQKKIRSIQSVESGNSTYERWNAHVSQELLPITNTSYFVSDIYENMWTKHHVYGHYTEVRNPLQTFSVVEPFPSGCKHNTTATAEATANSRKCLVAQNGGYFNISTGACIGNIISDSKIVQDAKGVMNAHFGITSNGSILTGYFSESDLYDLNFTQLVGGVIWLVRNGSSFVNEAVRIENRDAEDTGTLRFFADILSARTAIGHNREGKIIFVQIDGQTGQRGANLEGFAKLLIEELGIVNAINLDGGGSGTLVLNGTLANYPSDHCRGAPMWRCARPVSTIVCAHEPECNPQCENGKCVLGKCECDSNWIGESCDELLCGSNNCSHHGVCKPDGCHCSAGWRGIECSYSCPKGFYGVNCSQACFCENGSKCDPVTGHCQCGAGYKGKACDQPCPPGSYGKNCRHFCHCSDTCSCDAKTGVCLAINTTDTNQSLFNVSYCLARKLEKSTKKTQESYDLSMLELLCFVTAALLISICFNILVMWKYVSSKPKDFYNRGYQHLAVHYESFSTTESSFEEEDTETEVEGENRSRVKEFLQNCFHFRTFPYTKLNGTNDVYEMDEVIG